MKRIRIDWEIISANFCEGEATIDEWTDNQMFVDTPFRTTKLPVRVQPNSTSTKNIPAYISKDIRKEITSMMQIFFSGVTHNTYSCYKWLDLGE
jgi:hypothetical protein